VSWRERVWEACALLLLLVLFLLSASYAVDTGNAVADLVATFLFFALVGVVVLVLLPVLSKIFPKRQGYVQDPVRSKRDGEIWMYYPPIYRKVPFASLIVTFVVVAYVEHLRLSLPVVQARGMQEEALTAVFVFALFLILWTWPVFVWIYSAFYRVTPEGFQWMAPWSRKRFVRWSEVTSVWYTPVWGMGIWIRTHKGRFRIDYDMVNAYYFVQRLRDHAPGGRGLDLIR